MKIDELPKTLIAIYKIRKDDGVIVDGGVPHYETEDSMPEERIKMLDKLFPEFEHKFNRYKLDK